VSDLWVLMEKRIMSNDNSSQLPFKILRMAINATSAETVAAAFQLKDISTVHRMTDPLSGRANPVARVGALLSVLKDDVPLVKQIFEYLAWSCGGIYVLSQDELTNFERLQEALQKDESGDGEKARADIDTRAV
jgi:hypothetical protein